MDQPALLVESPTSRCKLSWSSRATSFLRHSSGARDSPRSSMGSGLAAQEGPNVSPTKTKQPVAKTNQPKTRRVHKAGCKVPGCDSKLHEEREFNQRHRLCEEHQRALVLDLPNGHKRFCQQCNRLHPLSSFDGEKRGCRVRLERHNKRRRIRKQLARQLAPGAAGGRDAPAGSEAESDKDAEADKREAAEEDLDAEEPARKMLAAGPADSVSNHGRSSLVSPVAPVATGSMLTREMMARISPSAGVMLGAGPGVPRFSNEDEVEHWSYHGKAIPRFSGPFDRGTESWYAEAHHAAGRHPRSGRGAPPRPQMTARREAAGHQRPLAARVPTAHEGGDFLQRLAAGSVEAAARGYPQAMPPGYFGSPVIHWQDYYQRPAPRPRAPGLQHELLGRAGYPLDRDTAHVNLAVKLSEVTPADLPPDLQEQLVTLMREDPQSLMGYVRPGCVHLSVDMYLHPGSNSNAVIENLANGIISSVQGGNNSLWCSHPIQVLLPGNAISATDGLVEISSRDGSHPSILSAARIAICNGSLELVCGSWDDEMCRVFCRINGAFYDLEVVSAIPLEDPNLTLVTVSMPLSLELGVAWIEIISESPSGALKMAEAVPLLVTDREEIADEICRFSYYAPSKSSVLRLVMDLEQVLHSPDEASLDTCVGLIALAASSSWHSLLEEVFETSLSHAALPTLLEEIASRGPGLLSLAVLSGNTDTIVEVCAICESMGAPCGATDNVDRWGMSPLHYVALSCADEPLHALFELCDGAEEAWDKLTNAYGFTPAALKAISERGMGTIITAGGQCIDSECEGEQAETVQNVKAAAKHGQSTWAGQVLAAGRSVAKYGPLLMAVAFQTCVPEGQWLCLRNLGFSLCISTAGYVLPLISTLASSFEVKPRTSPSQPFWRPLAARLADADYCYALQVLLMLCFCASSQQWFAGADSSSVRDILPGVLATGGLLMVPFTARTRVPLDSALRSIIALTIGWSWVKVAWTYGITTSGSATLCDAGIWKPFAFTVIGSCVAGYFGPNSMAYFSAVQLMLSAMSLYQMNLHSKSGVSLVVLSALSLLQVCTSSSLLMRSKQPAGNPKQPQVACGQ